VVNSVRGMSVEYLILCDSVSGDGAVLSKHDVI